MSVVKLFTEASLADVTGRLGEHSEALAHYQRSTSAAIDMLADPLLDLALVSPIIADCADFCAEHNIEDVSREFRSRLSSLAGEPLIDGNRARELEILAARFVLAEKGVDAFLATFRDIVERGSESYGTRSDEVQSVYATCADILIAAGQTDRAFEMMRARLLELDYWYLERIRKIKLESEDRISDQIEREVARANSLEEKNKAVIDELTAKANDAYAAGDNEAAYQKFEEAVELGSLYCTFMLGTFNQCGIGSKVDLERARELYLAAARRGHDISQHYYGALLQMGLGGEADTVAAAYWYFKAAEQGYAPALMNLSGVYLSVRKGFLTAPSFPSSIEILIRAAEAGASNALGTIRDYFRLPVSQLVRV